MRGAGDVRIAEETGGAAARDRGLLRPRIHARQRPLRAHRRPRQQDASGEGERIEALRAEGKPTLPTTIGEELATNPFLRWADPEIRKNLGMENASDAEVFAEIRKRKDNF